MQIFVTKINKAALFWSQLWHILKNFDRFLIPSNPTIDRNPLLFSKEYEKKEISNCQICKWNWNTLFLSCEISLNSVTWPEIRSWIIIIGNFFVWCKSIHWAYFDCWQLRWFNLTYRSPLKSHWSRFSALFGMCRLKKFSHMAYQVSSLSPLALYIIFSLFIHPVFCFVLYFSQAMSGFLMMLTQNGKLLYISDNAAEYLGHSMVSIEF